jgi:hypothetical protein
MRVDTLPSPGLLSNGIRIRIEAAKAISAVEINAGVPANGGKATAAKPLADFFTACAASLSSYLDVTAPTVVARAIAPSKPKRVTLTMSEGMDPKNIPALTSFVFTTQVRTVEKITVDGPFIHVDVTTPFVAGAVNIAYTQPGTLNLRDISQNLLANFTAAAVTNGL